MRSVLHLWRPGGERGNAMVEFESAPTITYTPNFTSPCLNRSGQTVTVTISGNARIDLRQRQDRPPDPLLEVVLSGSGTFVRQ